MNRALIFLVISFMVLTARAQQSPVDTLSKKEIKAIRKINRNQNTYSFYRLQQVSIQSSIWQEAREEKKMLLKALLPKVYEFVNSTSVFEITLLMNSRKKGRKLKEVLVKSSATGLKRPRMIGVILQNDYSDLSDRILRISGQQFYSPLFYPGKYSFTARKHEGENRSFTALHFAPEKPTKWTLEGYMYLNEQQLIEYFQASPTDTNESFEALFMIENMVLGDSLVHPGFVKLENEVRMGANKRNVLHWESTNQFLEVEPSNDELRTSNIILDFDQQNDTIATPYDSLFRVDTSKATFPGANQVNNMLNYVEALRFGRLGAGKFDFLVNHIANFNLVEGLRLGIGLATNARLSERFDVGGYLDGGLRDEKFKYGGFGNLYLHKKSAAKLNVTYINDLVEPGKTYFPFQRKLFINEGYRRFGLSRLDRVNRLDARFNVAFLKNIFLETGFTFRIHRPLYEYAFRDDSAAFTTQEITAGIRYNPDEKFFKLNNRLYSLGSRYPSFYLNYTLGNGPYQYMKFDMKVEKEINLLQYGKLNFQLIGGYLTNQAIPYPYLYNMKGSYKPGTPIIHNTFGTMGYNEFAAGRYAALFYLHNLGKVAHRKTFQPELLLLHNMGIANTLPVTQHQHITLNTMEKGFVESGFYLKNLVALQIALVQTGFGMGFMYRYGPYQFDRSIDNLVFKFSLDFDI